MQIHCIFFLGWKDAIEFLSVVLSTSWNGAVLLCVEWKNTGPFTESLPWVHGRYLWDSLPGILLPYHPRDILSPKFLCLLQGLMCSGVTGTVGHCQVVLGSCWPKLGQLVPYFWIWEWMRMANLSQFTQDFPRSGTKSSMSWKIPAVPSKGRQLVSLGWTEH